MHVRPPDNHRHAVLQRADLVVGRPLPFRKNVEHVSLPQAMNRLLQSTNVPLPLPQRKRVEPAIQPCPKRIAEQFGLTDEIEWPLKKSPQNGWIQIALMVRDDENSAIHGNVLRMSTNLVYIVTRDFLEHVGEQALVALRCAGRDQ